MKNVNALQEPFNYLKGREATNQIKAVFGIEKDTELAELFNIPKGTLATWHQRNLTPFELILRASLATNVDIKALALGQGDLFSGTDVSSKVLTMPAISIFGGRMEELDSVTLDRAVLPEQIATDNLAFFITDHRRYIVDCSDTDIIQGRYIVEIDGRYSLNSLQRLGKDKIAMQIYDSSISIDKSQLTILGKVICSINQEY